MNAPRAAVAFGVAAAVSVAVRLHNAVAYPPDWADKALARILVSTLSAMKAVPMGLRKFSITKRMTYKPTDNTINSHW